MSHQTVFRQKVSPWPSLLALGLGVSMTFLALSPIDLTDPKHAAACLGLIAPGSMLAWGAFIASRRVVQFDQQTGKVSIECRSLLGVKRKGTASLWSYTRVVSYIPIGSDLNWVALVSLDDRTYLHLLHFLPSTTSTSFWSSPSKTESPSARGVREQLRDDVGLIDLGFLGTYVPENYRHRMV
jgi:hypothetical protein